MPVGAGRRACDCGGRGFVLASGWLVRGVLRGVDTIADTEDNGRDSSEERDDSAFERLFELFFDWTRKRLVAKGFTPAEGEDLAQETFVRVYKGLSGFRGESSIRTWIWTIAWRLAANHRRFAQAQKRFGLELAFDDENCADPAWQASPGPNPLQQAIGRETLQVLAAALEQLPPQRRRALSLRMDGYKYEEIAAIQKISVQSVRSHLHQGRRQMRELLSDRAGEIGEEPEEEP